MSTFRAWSITWPGTGFPLSSYFFFRLVYLTIYYSWRMSLTMVFGKFARKSLMTWNRQYSTWATRTPSKSAKQQFCSCITFLCTFLLPQCRFTTWKCQRLLLILWRTKASYRWNYTIFLLLNLDMVSRNSLAWGSTFIWGEFEKSR